jgi:tetratricopeptide (TPR) repeat protein
MANQYHQERSVRDVKWVAGPVTRGRLVQIGLLVVLSVVALAFCFPYLVVARSVNLGMLDLVRSVSGRPKTDETALVYLTQAEALGNKRASCGLLFLTAQYEQPLNERVRCADDDYWLLLYGIQDLYGSSDRHGLCRAQDCFDRVLREYPDSSTTHFYLGRTLQLQGEPSKALVHFQTALRLNQFDKRFSRITGDTNVEAATPMTAVGAMIGVYMDMQQWKEAEQAARDFQSQFPETGQGEYWLGEIMLNTGRPEEAVSYLQFAAQRKSDSYVYLLLGRAYRRLGQIGPAIDAYERSYNLSPSGSVLWELGEYYVKYTSRKADGVALLSRFLQDLPHDCSSIWWWRTAGEFSLETKTMTEACTFLNEGLEFCSDEQTRKLVRDNCNHPF